MGSVEFQGDILGHLDRKAFVGNAVVPRDLLDKRQQIWAHPDGLRLNAVAPREFEHVVYHALQAPRIVPDDLHHALLMRSALFFLQEVPGMRDGREGIADLVGYVSREPSERRELELLGLLLELGQIL